VTRMSADMFRHFEKNTDFLDADRLRAGYPDVAWHSSVGWDLVLANRTTVRWPRRDFCVSVSVFVSSFGGRRPITVSA